MSLTSHLNDPKSPLNRFFSELFTNTRPVTRECSAKLSGAETIRPIPKVPFSTLGTALDYRTRYYFSVTQSKDFVAWQGAALLSDEPLGEWEDTDQYYWTEPNPGLYQDGPDGPFLILRNWHGQTQQYAGNDRRNALLPTPHEHSLPAGLINNFFSSLDKVLQETQPAGRRLDRSQEEQLVRYCVVLALFEEVFRAGARSGSPLFLGEAKTTVPELLSISEAEWVSDLCSLSWLFHERFGEVLTHPNTLNPTFDGSKDVGGADADFILDGCLIDINEVDPKIRTGG